MPGMTMTEQILAKHSGRARVEPGENVWVNVDVLMTHDVCGPGTIGIFHECRFDVRRRPGCRRLVANDSAARIDLSISESPLLED